MQNTTFKLKALCYVISSTECCSLAFQIFLKPWNMCFLKKKTNQNKTGKQDLWLNLVITEPLLQIVHWRHTCFSMEEKRNQQYFKIGFHLHHLSSHLISIFKVTNSILLFTERKFNSALSCFHIQ